MSQPFAADRSELVRRAIDPEPHIKVDGRICAKCSDSVCARVCPAECFTFENGQVTFSHQTCLECGACRVSCRSGALDWNYPKGGFGVAFRY